MGRMPELDFIDNIEGKPLTREEAAEISEWIHRHKSEAALAGAARERIEAEALALPAAERNQLVHRLVASLAAGEARLPEPAAEKSRRHEAPQAVTRRKAAQSRPARRKATIKKSVTANAH